jgi:hypothetical protein
MIAGQVLRGNDHDLPTTARAGSEHCVVKFRVEIGAKIINGEQTEKLHAIRGVFPGSFADRLVHGGLEAIVTTSAHSISVKRPQGINGHFSMCQRLRNVIEI